jgi:hypothetical protein
LHSKRTRGSFFARPSRDACSGASPTS